MAESYKTSHGYRRLRETDEYEHRVVAERLLGRPLAADEIVHHLNGNKADNRPENLEILASHREHMGRHCTVTDIEIAQEILRGTDLNRVARRMRTSEHRVIKIRRTLPASLVSRAREIRRILDARPRHFDWEAARRLRELGLGYREISRRLGVSHYSIRYALNATVRGQKKKARARRGF